jgi:uncharacterized protein
MSLTVLIIVAVAVFAVAVLYASVGFGGGTGYLAVIALAGLASEEIRATALVLNVVVALIGTIQFARKGHFDWRLLTPFLLSSIPAAFAAGRWMKLDPHIYEIVLGVILIYAAYRLWGTRVEKGADVERPPIVFALIGGAVIGLISGLVGVGGGVFLAPMLLLAGWATPRQTAGATAPFILLNSAAALIGLLLSDDGLAVQPTALGAWVACVAVGGFIGATSGATFLPPRILRITLCLVLLVAAARMILF